MPQTYLWEGVTVEGEHFSGIEEGSSLKQLKKILHHRGIFRSKITLIPIHKLNSPLPGQEIIKILNSLFLLLQAGIPLIHALDFLTKEKRSIPSQYIFCILKERLHRGQSLEEVFRGLQPMLPELVTVIISISERTGKLKDALVSLTDYFVKQEERNTKVKNLIRYPLTLVGISFFISIGILLFIVPMFRSIYHMIGDNLPLPTRILVFLSQTVNHYGLWFLSLIVILALISQVQSLKQFYPWYFIQRKFVSVIRTLEDPLIYSHAMSILLKNGIPTQIAVDIAAHCMSEENQIHGEKVLQKLHTGKDFSIVFQEISWFPEIYKAYITTAEQAGQIALGFSQIYQFLQSKGEERFQQYSKWIEPILMLFLGGIVLFLLLAIYLPLFEIGNYVG